MTKHRTKHKRDHMTQSNAVNMDGTRDAQRNVYPVANCLCTEHLSTELYNQVN